MRRLENQDRYLLDDEQRLYMVADGMGGYAGGKLAASIAVDVIQQSLRAWAPALVAPHRPQPKEHPMSVLFPEAVLKACSRIFIRATKEPDLSNMGTTFTGCAFADGHVFVAHVGDSRAYLLRDGTIRQLSTDHTLVAEMVQAGHMPPQAAQTSRMRHVLSRSVGNLPEVEVDLYAQPTQEGDIFLLCSDGLVNLVEDQEILDTVLDHFLKEAPSKLVELANARGGDDNITVVVLAVTSDADRDL